MKILLLGATGRLGRLVLEVALEKGYEVHCLARNSERIKDRNGLVTFEGNAAQLEDLEMAIRECTFIINTLNISRKSDFPWSSIRTPKTYLSEVMKNLVFLAGRENIYRIVTCSAWGVAETRKHIPGWFRWLVDHSNIGVAYLDHERQEKLLESGNTDWTIVRPVGLTNSDKSESVRESFNNRPVPNLTVSRLSVAKYMVNSITSQDLSCKKVVISGE